MSESKGSQVEIGPGVWVAADLLRVQFARSSGPGGQNVNKVNTKTEIWVPIQGLSGLSNAAKFRLAEMAGHRLTSQGEIHISADDHRTQEANRAAAFERLRELIVRAQHVPKVRRKTKPSRASRQRRLDSKRRRGEVKQGRRSGME